MSRTNLVIGSNSIGIFHRSNPFFYAVFDSTYTALNLAGQELKCNLLKGRRINVTNQKNHLLKTTEKLPTA
jgi:hypothetical protein